MDKVDDALSREATEALNASMPDVVKTAGYGTLTTGILLIVPFCGVAVGFLAAIFGPVLPSALEIILAIFAVLIGMLVVALVVGLRAKRAFNHIAEIVQRERGATLVRVANHQVFVRR